jgi:uncharacterized integral membrane protein
MSVEHTKFDHHEEPGDTPARKGPSATLVGLAIVVALLVVFFLQNSRSLKIKFLFFDKTTTIRWSLLIAVVLGALLDRIFTLWWRRRRRRSETV